MIDREAVWKPFGLCLLVSACGPGWPGESGSGSESTAGGTSTAGTTSSTGAATTTSASTISTGEATVTGAPTSTSTTTPPVLTLPADPTSSTSGTSDTTGGSTSTGPGFETCDGLDWSFDTDGELPSETVDCIDPQIDWPEPHLDCVLDCSTMTSIHGEGPAAAIESITRASFGVVHDGCAKGLLLRRLYLGNPWSYIFVGVGLECPFDPWLGSHPVTAWLPDNQKISATLTIEGFAGDWQSVDPVDPPRILGSFSGDLVGPFEAVHCALLDEPGACGE